MHGLMTYPERVDPSRPLNHRYEGIIDVMLANPDKSRGELAEMMGFTPGWFSNVCNNNAFQARWGYRRGIYNGELDEKLTAKLHTIADTALEKVIEALNEDEVDKGYALDASTKALRNLGFGAPKSVSTKVELNNTQVNLTDDPALQEVLRKARDRVQQVAKLLNGPDPAEST